MSASYTAVEDAAVWRRVDSGGIIVAPTVSCGWCSCDGDGGDDDDEHEDAAADEADGCAPTRCSTTGGSDTGLSV